MNYEHKKEAPPSSHIYNNKLHLTNNRNRSWISVFTQERTPLETVATRCYPIYAGVQILIVAHFYLTGSLLL